MKTYFNREVMVITVALLCYQLTGCGTILYPERRNKEPGRLDVGIVLLDAFWLLVGIIPGIIAFAVDFSSGAIYLPEHRLSGEPQRMRVVRFDPQHTSRAQLEAMISRETGQKFNFDDERVQYTRVKSKEEAGAYLAGVKQ